MKFLKNTLIISILLVFGAQSVSAAIPDAAREKQCDSTSRDGKNSATFPCESPPDWAIAENCDVRGSRPVVRFWCELPPPSSLQAIASQSCFWINSTTNVRSTSFTCGRPPPAAIGNICVSTSGERSEFICQIINPPATPSASQRTPYQQCLIDTQGSEAGVDACRGLSGDPTGSYFLLEPLKNPFGGGDLTYVETAGDNALGKYLNIIIRLAIGIAGVLAVIMIVMGGIQYMTTELVHSKGQAKERITNAILGLLVALGAWLILNTINPALVSTKVDIPETQIAYFKDEAAFALTEVEAATGATFQLSGTRSPGVDAFIQNHLSKGQSLSYILVLTDRNRARFYLANNQFVEIPIKVGQGGTSTFGTGEGGDLKTPKGTTAIRQRIAISTDGRTAIQTLGQGKKYNLGAAFINTGAKDASGNDRAIGFHGAAGAGLGGATNGCIRMTNDDLLALGPYMKAGTQVIIQ